MKKVKEIIGKINEFRKKPYGSSVLFFGFYFIFFIVVITLIRTSPVKTNTEYQKSNDSFINMKSILNKNYSFTYNVVLDNNIHTYKGDKLNEVVSFKYNEKEYYQNSNNSYIKNDSWISVETPIKFKYFFDEEILYKVVSNSYYESKTAYESGKTVYNFLISSNSLNNIIDSNETDYDEIPNKLSISVNDDIEEITFNLDSYCLLNKLCDKSLKITINYDNYNGVKEIKNPINN